MTHRFPDGWWLPFATVGGGVGWAIAAYAGGKWMGWW